MRPCPASAARRRYVPVSTVDNRLAATAALTPFASTPTTRIAASAIRLRGTGKSAVRCCANRIRGRENNCLRRIPRARTRACRATRPAIRGGPAEAGPVFSGAKPISSKPGAATASKVCAGSREKRVAVYADGQDEAVTAQQIQVFGVQQAALAVAEKRRSSPRRAALLLTAVMRKLTFAKVTPCEASKAGVSGASRHAAGGLPGSSGLRRKGKPCGSTPRREKSGMMVGDESFRYRRVSPAIPAPRGGISRGIFPCKGYRRAFDARDGKRRQALAIRTIRTRAYSEFFVAIDCRLFRRVRIM